MNCELLNCVQIYPVTLLILFQLNKAGDVTLNPHSWHHSTNLLFLDQPVGTGLAYTLDRRYPRSDKEVNEAFVAMLVRFFALHPQYVAEIDGHRVTRPIVLAGESHAGHYIPSMAKHIMERNAEVARADSGGLILLIDGLAIGNGWIDPFHQYDVSDYVHGQGLISDGQRHTMKVTGLMTLGVSLHGLIFSFGVFRCYACSSKRKLAKRLSAGASCGQRDASRYLTTCWPPPAQSPGAGPVLPLLHRGA